MQAPASIPRAPAFHTAFVMRLGSVLLRVILFCSSLPLPFPPFSFLWVGGWVSAWVSGQVGGQVGG